jgi:hypothetical protein
MDDTLAFEGARPCAVWLTGQGARYRARLATFAAGLTRLSLEEVVTIANVDESQLGGVNLVDLAGDEWLERSTVNSCCEQQFEGQEDSVLAGKTYEYTAKPASRCHRQSKRYQLPSRCTYGTHSQRSGILRWLCCLHAMERDIQNCWTHSLTLADTGTGNVIQISGCHKLQAP